VTSGTSNIKARDNNQNKQMQDRRTKKKGGMYFFSVNLATRKRNLLFGRIDHLREAMKQTG
jgi:hypothetical protein